MGWRRIESFTFLSGITCTTARDPARNRVGAGDGWRSVAVRETGIAVDQASILPEPKGWAAVIRTSRKPSYTSERINESYRPPFNNKLDGKQGIAMDVFARLIELKPGSSDRVDAWARHLDEHRESALESLRAEGVSVESWFSLSLGGKDYLLCYMRADSLEESQKVAANSGSPVDSYHQQFKVDTWVRGAGAVGKLLLDLSPGSEE